MNYVKIILIILFSLSISSESFAKKYSSSYRSYYSKSYKSKSYKKYSNSSPVHVRGYYRKNGTYVKPHYRTRANGSKLDNWSHKGNVNPYTGKTGTKDN